MEVFVIPIGRERYELYCEMATTEPVGDAEGVQSGMFGRLWHHFSATLRAAEERHRAGEALSEAEAGTWRVRFQNRALAWLAERIAEQRLLWNLRKETAAEAIHPQDMTFEQVLTLIHRILRRDYDRHRLWLVFDSILFIVSGVLALVPGPNIVAYYFAFRVVGHWLSMRGASQGLFRIAWSGRGCEPLTELREVVTLDAPARHARVSDVASRLRLRHLSTFFERVAVRAA